MHFLDWSTQTSDYLYRITESRVEHWKLRHLSEKCKIMNNFSLIRGLRLLFICVIGIGSRAICF